MQRTRLYRTVLYPFRVPVVSVFSACKRHVPMAIPELSADPDPDPDPDVARRAEVSLERLR